MLESDPSKYEKVSKYMMLAADNGLSIIDFVRKRSAVEENKVSISLKKHHLKGLIEESSFVLYQQFKNKNVLLRNRVNDDHYILVDKPSFVNSVINNLLSNAIKFSFPGDSVEVDSSQIDDLVSLTVTDRGIGMPSKILDSIFDPGKKPTGKEQTVKQV